MTMIEERPITIAEWEQFHRRDASARLSEVPWPDRALTKADVYEYGFPQAGLPKVVNDWRAANLPNLKRGLRTRQIAAKYGIPTLFGALWIRVWHEGEWIDFGLASMRLVTDTGVGYIVDAFQNIVEVENMKFHGLGIGTGAEASGDSALGTELTTEYNPNSTRATGTTTETSANIYRTVATNTIDSGTPAVTEHGIFSASTSGVLLDRSKFSAINLVANDGIQTTYDLTFTSGG